MVEAGAVEGAVERVVIGVEMVRAVAKTEVRVVAEKAARVKEVGEKAAARPAVVKRARVWALGVTSAVAREAVTGGVRSEAAT